MIGGGIKEVWVTVNRMYYIRICQRVNSINKKKQGSIKGD